MIRQLAIAVVAVAALALVANPTAGISAQSSKPKEIVVVGSKTKVKPSIKQRNTEPGGVKRYNMEQAWPSK